jgi:hypothetical protein
MFAIGSFDAMSQPYGFRVGLEGWDTMFGRIVRFGKALLLTSSFPTPKYSTCASIRPRSRPFNPSMGLHSPTDMPYASTHGLQEPVETRRWTPMFVRAWNRDWGAD